jgi:hypothetical protein
VALPALVVHLLQEYHAPLPAHQALRCIIQTNINIDPCSLNN